MPASDFQSGLTSAAPAIVVLYLFSALAALAAVRYTRLPWLISERGWRRILWCSIALQLVGIMALGKAARIGMGEHALSFEGLPLYSNLIRWGWKSLWSGAIAMFFAWFSLKADAQGDPAEEALQMPPDVGV